MKLIFKKALFLFLLIAISDDVMAQETWPSPEIEQMYHNAQEYMELGNLQDAIVTYKQAILLAPQKILLYEGLADAYCRSGKYMDAEQLLNPLLAKANANALCYDLLAASQAGQKKIKEAKITVDKGLGRFPASGLLYHRAGLIYRLEKKKEEAISAWLNGISIDPVYALNYQDAALVYLSADDVTWGILYAEIYLAMAHDTLGDQLFKKKLFDGYKTMFEHIAGEEVLQYGHTKVTAQPGSFISAVQQVYSQLTPVISDGITTENLTMVRTRFLMDWFAAWNSKYPFALFSYQDQLIRNGYFDMYNEWLFGKAENITEYNAWNTFHDGEMDLFTTWKSLHMLAPVTNDFYNNRDIDFLEKK